MSESVQAISADAAAGGDELLIIPVVATLILWCVNKKFPPFMGDPERAIREFSKALTDSQSELEKAIGERRLPSAIIGEALTETNHTVEIQESHEIDLFDNFRQMKDRILLLLAEGFGIGRIPFAPGTFGSLVGLVWFGLLMRLGSFPVYLFGMVAGIGVSVWLCGEGERILGKKDPGSVVMDEIIAIPICFTVWVTAHYFSNGAMPNCDLFFTSWLPQTIGIFVAFRLFDVLKPWPVHQSQSLPGGWGVTIDDVLAAVYVNLVFAGAMAFHPAIAG